VITKKNSACLTEMLMERRGRERWCEIGEMEEGWSGVDGG
jgi:hypothetical protein